LDDPFLTSPLACFFCFSPFPSLLFNLLFFLIFFLFSSYYYFIHFSHLSLSRSFFRHSRLPFPPDPPIRLPGPQPRLFLTFPHTPPIPIPALLLLAPLPLCFFLHTHSLSPSSYSPPLLPRIHRGFTPVLCITSNFTLLVSRFPDGLPEPV
jgi:hypothetical protein